MCQGETIVLMYKNPPNLTLEFILLERGSDKKIVVVSVLQLKNMILIQDPVSGVTGEKVSRVSLVDLAGSLYDRMEIDEKDITRRRRQETSKHESKEPKFVNISGAQESIPRNILLGF